MSRHRSGPARQKGFTLTEILVALAIFTIILVAALMIYDRSNKVFKTGVESADMQQNTRVAFDKLVSDIRMIGFDFDRDGNPSGSVISGGTTYYYYQQADEQIEYIGEGAIAFRSNFDYDDGTNDHGIEPTYAPLNFPVVTTANDEIVAYVMRSADASKNTQTVTFYADTFKPRKVYPGGSAECQVDIANVDTTNNNPPYTLYRVYLAEGTTACSGATPQFVPIATNIRSLNFTYYLDTAGQYVLNNLDSTPFLSTDTVAAKVGGQGQYDPANPAPSTIPRAQRSRVQSIGVQLVGMNEVADPNYVDPAETLAAAKGYRKHRITSLVVLRNANKHGFKEQELRAPGVPSLDQICVGWCGNSYLKWSAPPVTSANGAPESYAILYYSEADATDIQAVNVGNKLDAFVADLLNTNQTYHFAIQAINASGSTSTGWSLGYSVKNVTTPDAPTNLLASGNSTGTPAAEENQVSLTWTRPLDKSGTISCSTGTAPTGADAMPVTEIKGWRIQRKLSSESTWPATFIVDENSTDKPIIDEVTNVVTWVDHSPGNCYDYDYRVMEVEGQDLACGPSSDTTYNNGASGYSAWSSTATGSSTSTNAPSAPSNLTIDDTVSACGVLPTDDCTVKLVWPRVTTDTASNTIEVLQYQIVETARHDDDTSETPVATSSSPRSVTPADWTTEGTGQLSYTFTVPKSDLTDPLLPRTWRYYFSVQAIQCSITGAASVERTYPCDIPGVTVSAAPTVIVMGTGTSGDPWVTAETASINVTVSGDTVDRITARLYSGAGAVIVGENTGTLSSATFGWPSGLTDGVIYALEIEVQKGDCVKTVSYSISQSANNCCLQPYKDETGIVLDSSVLSAPGTDSSGHLFSRVRLKNNCALDLTFSGSAIEIRWTSSRLASAGGRKMTSVDLPAASGTGVVTYNIPSSAGGDPTIFIPVSTVTGAKQFIPAGGTYVVDVHYTNDFSTQPIDTTCVTYSNSVGTDVCRIVPSPSPTDGTCP